MSAPDETKPELLKRLNDALNSQRAIHGYTNDHELAHHLGVSPKTVSFWRNGRWPQTTSALVTALLTSPQKAA